MSTWNPSSFSFTSVFIRSVSYTHLSSIEKTTTPLQEKLDRLGKGITVLGASAAAIVFLLQVVQFFMAGTLNLNTVSDAFITSIVLIVAAVPEGLPTIVAVSLALNIIKMSRENALVKKMIACETIGDVYKRQGLIGRLKQWKDSK